MAMESSPQREMPLSMFGPGGRRGTLNQDSIEEEAHMGEDEAEVVDGDVQSSVKRRIRRWAMDTMQQRADDLSTESTSFLDGMDAQMGLTARTSSDSPDESLHPPDLSSHPSGETVNTITTDSSGAMLMGIESSPTPLHGVKRELVAYPRPTQQGQIGLGIFAPKEETQECSLIQQLKRGKRNMVVQVLQGDPTSKDLGKSPTPAPSLSRFSFSKSHSSPIVPTLNSISFGSGSGEDDRMRKPSLTESTTSSIWQNTLPTRGTLDENDTHSRKTSSKLSFSSIKGLTKKASPLLEYRPQFTPPPVRPTISPQLNGPDGPPSPFEASSESTNSRCNSFLRELQASTSRPPIARRTTAPAKSSPKESNDLPPLPANASSNVLGHMQSQLPHQLVGTPVHVFDSERPSPAAFMSTGLIKKGSGFNSKRAGSEHSLPSSAVNSSGSLSNAFERTKATNMLVDSPLHSAPDTPIKYPVHHGSNPLVSSHKQCLPPLKFGNNASTAPIKPTSLGICTNPSPESDDAESKDDQSSLPTGESNGTISGNSIRFPVGAIVKLDFSTITPSPPAPNARHYPFASSSNLPKIEIANSPTSPLKKSGILARLPKHRALARVSNPLLSAAYKLGEQQANLRAMTFVTPSADSKHKLKIARRVSTSSLGGSDSRFERDFVMLGPIGVGEFSTVWKVREKRNGTVWAVKRGKPYVGEKDRTRQLEEVAILSTLAAVPHPNILQFQEAWEEKRQLHIRTALADCGDFATYVQSISDDGGLDEGRSWKVLHELSEGLRHIHSLGILHLDLKPANILIDQSGMLQISDFGLSIRLASLTPDGYPVVPEGDVFNVREGDREYLSPEMLEGVYGTFSDVFSLGATMLEVAFNIVLPSNEWEEWSRQRARDNELSPETTKVESHFIETIDGVRLHGPAKPALVQEDPGFLDKLLA
ncbi:hypothetical protein QFC19_004090 [Naganishia cerealis]|uniref:Uncharacterized protein n=1 Tax=Naganishia cerealis TaxID=610337 RepID=A0ACC2VY92_9TREE|nr:hypothetical protein QFC19_004090 [Naganishia cerealis]